MINVVFFLPTLYPVINIVSGAANISARDQQKSLPKNLACVFITHRGSE